MEDKQIEKLHVTNSQKNITNQINVNSPRSKEACKVLGIDIKTLKTKTIEDFLSARLDEELIQLHYDHYVKKQKSAIRKIKAYKIQKYGNRIEMPKESLFARGQLGISEWVFRSKTPPQGGSSFGYDKLNQSTYEAKSQKQKNEIKRLIEMDQKRVNSEVRWNQKLKKIEQTYKNKEMQNKKTKKEMEKKFSMAKEKLQKIENQKKSYQKNLQTKMNRDLAEATKKEKFLKEQQKKQLQLRELEAERKRQEIKQVLEERENQQTQLAMRKLMQIHSKFENSARQYNEGLNKRSEGARAKTAKVFELRSQRASSDTANSIMQGIVEKQEKASLLKQDEAIKIKKALKKQRIKLEEKKKLAEDKRMKDKQLEMAKQKKRILEKLNVNNTVLENKQNFQNKQISYRQEKRRLHEEDKLDSIQRAKFLQEMKRERIIEKLK